MAYIENQSTHQRWDTRFVMYWPDGDPLDEQDLTVMNAHLDTLNAVTSHDLEANPTLPFVCVDLGLSIDEQEVDDDIDSAEDEAARTSEAGRETYADTIVFKKGLAVTLGALSSIGVDLSIVELSNVYAVPSVKLIEYRKELERADLPYIASMLITRYAIDETARSIYRQERAACQEQISLEALFAQ